MTIKTLNHADYVYNVSGVSDNLTLDVSGRSSVSFETDPQFFNAIVNLADHSDLLMIGKRIDFDTLMVNGRGVLTNNTTIDVQQHGIISTDVDGKGTILATKSRSTYRTTIEFKGGVGQGQDVRLYGDNGGITTAQVDDPAKFRASVGIYAVTPGMAPFETGFLDLRGLHATSYDVRHGMLELFNGKHMIDSVRLDAGTQVSNVWQQETGVMANIGVSQPWAVSSGTLLPLHT